MPLRAAFDDATEVDRSVGVEIRTSELFRRFAAHYGLDYSFTNPYSGNEKGFVENKVGALRPNLFVPMPQTWDVKLQRRAAAQDAPGPLRRQAALPQGRTQVRALRGQPYGALAAARSVARMHDVAHQVISDSYERRSIVFTMNVEFSGWGTVFADDKLAAAIVGRVVHHGRLVEFGDPSHRLEESLMLGKSGS